jgi:hypothetical protein
MSGVHKNHIALAHRGTRQSAETKAKISKSLAGRESNHSGKKHTPGAKNRIGTARGHADRIKGKRWIVNSKEKTYRRKSAPDGFKVGQRQYNEQFKSFKQFIED